MIYNLHICVQIIEIHKLGGYRALRMGKGESVVEGRGGGDCWECGKLKIGIRPP